MENDLLWEHSSYISFPRFACLLEKYETEIKLKTKEEYAIEKRRKERSIVQH